MPLGSTQKRFLEMLKRTSGYTSWRCGWVWKNQSTTLRLLESLVKRGMVVKTEVTHESGVKYFRYTAR